jgi:hypothetical protein
MKVLFLYVSTNMCRDGDLWYYDEGAASVAACLRAAGHDAAFRMVRDDDSLEGLRAWVTRECGDGNAILLFLTSLMFSAYGHDLPQQLPLVAGLGAATGVPVGFAGIHATLNPEAVLALPGIDFVARGEIERALPEFCDALESGRPITGIANFWLKTPHGIQRNALRPLIDDLAALPLPARDLLPNAQMANERDGILTVIAMRGCPMDCNFCSNPVLKRLYAGNGGYTRFKPVGYVIKEIQAARRADPSIRAVFFHDDIFALHGAWAREFFARYPVEVGLPFGCNLVVGQASQALASDLRRAGCRQVQIGVESGSAYLRNEVLNKQLTDAVIERAIRQFQRAGIHVKLFAMMGLPQESRARYRESVRNLARWRPDMVQIQVWEAHEGSDLTGRDAAAVAQAGGHYRPGRDRRQWRRKFYFRWFHRYVALYEALDALASRRPLAARLLRPLVTASIRFRYAPELLMTHDWDGRLRWPGRLGRNPLLRAAARRLFGRFWGDVRARESRLAAVYIWPAELGPPPGGRGWSGSYRTDAREVAEPA